ncbi:MAG: hypothetical protein WDO16_01320 [Bacteroidota bacterium]
MSRFLNDTAKIMLDANPQWSLPRALNICTRLQTGPIGLKNPCARMIHRWKQAAVAI